jgi:hypothetical protein
LVPPPHCRQLAIGHVPSFRQVPGPKKSPPGSPHLANMILWSSQPLEYMYGATGHPLGENSAGGGMNIFSLRGVLKPSARHKKKTKGFVNPSTTRLVTASHAQPTDSRHHIKTPIEIALARAAGSQDWLWKVLGRLNKRQLPGKTDPTPLQRHTMVPGRARAFLYITQFCSVALWRALDAAGREVLAVKPVHASVAASGLPFAPLAALPGAFLAPAQRQSTGACKCTTAWPYQA